MVDMTALSILGPYALRRSVCSWIIQYSHTPQMMGFLGIGNNPMAGAAKRQGCATQLRYRSGYRRCIEQVIYCNSIDLRRVVRLDGSLFLLLLSNVILYLQNETKIARNRYLRKRTEAVKDKDYKLSLVL